MAATELQEVDFMVLREDYSRFLLRDGTVLKAKIVLKKIFFAPIRTPEGYPTNVGFDTANVVVAVVPQSLRRTPSTTVFDPRVDKGTDVEFQDQEIKEQEYMTTNGFKISIKPVLTKVFKYDKYNAYGEPIYNASLQAITKVDKIETTAT